MNNFFTRIGRTLSSVTPRSKERYFSAEKWDQSWSGGYDLNSVEEDARYGSLMSLMRRYEQNGPLLDVGCGDGLLEERYRELSNLRIVAFDYSAAAIERAKARQLVDVDFLCADSRTFRSKQNFSMVVLNESLYYVDDYLSMMTNLSSVLTADGVFLISMHETPIAKRIWKNVLGLYNLVQGATVKDETTGRTWQIRILQPRR